VFHTSIWEYWSFVWTAKPTNFPRGDGSALTTPCITDLCVLTDCCWQQWAVMTNRRSWASSKGIDVSQMSYPNCSHHLIFFSAVQREALHRNVNFERRVMTNVEASWHAIVDLHVIRFLRPVHVENKTMARLHLERWENEISPSDALKTNPWGNFFHNKRLKKIIWW